MPAGRMKLLISAVALNIASEGLWNALESGYAAITGSTDARPRVAQQREPAPPAARVKQKTKADPPPEIACPGCVKQRQIALRHAEPYSSLDEAQAAPDLARQNKVLVRLIEGSSGGSGDAGITVSMPTVVAGPSE
jgi:hypothetical protein